jgi:N-formylglutamate deformylase
VKPLPLVLSVPHAGTAIPEEVSAINRLSLAEIEQDGDEGAAEIYLPLESEVAAMVSTPIARAFVDQNRSSDDFSKDGVVKTHTCWDVPIYIRPLTTVEVRQLLAKYHEPYHLKLNAGARQALLGLDCHTMAAVAPPIGPGSAWGMATAAAARPARWNAWRTTWRLPSIAKWP